MKIAIVSACLLLIIPGAYGANYYVSSSGNDANTGSARDNAHAWKSLAYALKTVPAGKGHVINIGAGTFDLGGSSRIPTNTAVKGAGSSSTIIIGALFIDNGAEDIEVANLTLDGNEYAYPIALKVRDAYNIHVHDCTIRKFDTTALNLQRIIYGNFYKLEILDCGFSKWIAGGGGSQSTAVVIGDVSDVQIHDCRINTVDYRGGKGIGTSADYWTSMPWAQKATALTRLRIYNCDIKVNQYHSWGNGWSPQCVIELYHTKSTDVRICNNTFNRNVSLAGPGGTSQKVRVDHNIWHNPGYAIETDIDDVEIDHNLIIGGSYPIANFSAPRRVGKRIHHNIFESTKRPAPVMNMDKTRHDSILFVNNTINFTEGSDGGFFYFPYKSTGGVFVNNLFRSSGGSPKLGIDTSYGWIVDHNLFSGVVPSGTNALTGDALLPLVGSTVDSMYKPAAGSPAINAGVVVKGITDGYAGSAPDIGAVETGAAAWYPGIGGARVDNLEVPPRPASLKLQAAQHNGCSSGSCEGRDPKLNYFNSVELGTGTWIRFQSVNLRNGYDSLKIAYVFNDYGGNLSISIRLDSANGPEIGSVVPTQTGTWHTFKTASLPLSADAKGVHDIYVFNKGSRGGSIATLEFTQSINTPALPSQTPGGCPGKSGGATSIASSDWKHPVPQRGEGVVNRVGKAGDEVVFVGIDGRIALRRVITDQDIRITVPGPGPWIMLIRNPHGTVLHRKMVTGRIAPITRN